MLLHGSDEAMAYAQAWSLVLITEYIPPEAVVESHRFYLDKATGNVLSEATANTKYSENGAADPQTIDINFPNSIDQSSF